MTALDIKEEDIPWLGGKRCIVTGGSSGIGLATVHLLQRKGAEILILDISEPVKEDLPPDGVVFHRCDVTKWSELRESFFDVAHGIVDFVFANAGILDEGSKPYLVDEFDAQGRLLEPDYSTVDVNVKGVFNVVKLACSVMKARRAVQVRGQMDKGNGTAGETLPGGSIVITTSTAAYAPEQAFPLYSSGKAALIGLIRSLRTVVVEDDITINGVAPAPTATSLLPANLSETLSKEKVPVSDPAAVALALVYSATATQSRRVQTYGKEPDENLFQEKERWNGRVIFTFGNRYAELEEPIADARPLWLGRENEMLLKRQQAATDFRDMFN